jgi:NAD(P) transhydrogenase subunit alpha
MIEAGAGTEAGFPDSGYQEKGVKVAGSRAELFGAADVILQVRALGANPEEGKADLDLLRSGQVLVGACDPLGNPAAAKELAGKGVTLFALELVPRITRAQSMDILSSMATVAGYKAVLLGAEKLPRMFPMLMTAAGTVAPARVFIMGVGVAGLMAIGTARKLGGVVRAYDIRPAVKEQVESLGGKFVELDLETGDAEDRGGYAKAMGEEFYRRQRELMTEVVAESDVVITTAAVPGKKAPVLVTKEMVAAMAPGSVLVDLAAETGGNCELTRAGEEVVEGGVSILGPVNLPATVPYHASQMYAKNIATFLLNMVEEGKVEMDTDDEIVRDSMVCRGGEVVNGRVRDALGLGAAQGEEG